MEDTSLPLHIRLNLQTARITWPELERFFAQGRIIEVTTDLDLVEVAEALAEDNTDKFNTWTQTNQVKPLTTAAAKQWVNDDQNLWAVVVAPWVIVQNRQ